VTTARYVFDRSTRRATSASGTITLRGTFVWTAWPMALRNPIGSFRKPPFTTASRTPEMISCWRAWRVKSDSPAALRTRA
jgi:hypothetical protein